MLKRLSRSTLLSNGLPLTSPLLVHVFTALLLSGCTLPGSGTLLIPDDAHIITEVPGYNHKAFQCGPAALASVLNYWGSQSASSEIEDPAAIASVVYSEGARGALGIDLELYAADRGYFAEQYSGSFENLKFNLARGYPLIILVDYGFSVYQQNHFMVVTGYNGEGIIVYSEGQQRYIPSGELERPWNRTENWTLLIQPH